jgi:GAF domain-containing protein
VSSNEPNVTVKLDHVADAVAGLHEFMAATEPLDRALARIAEGSAGIIADVDAVTITVLTASGQPYTAASTDDRYLDIDKQQYAAGRGPCLHAARTRQPVRTSTEAHREEWPEFSVAAEQAGVTAYLSTPLLLTSVERDLQLLGSFNLYSHNPDGFDTVDEVVMRIFSAAATQAIDHARRLHRARDQIGNLEIALDSRAEIDHAKGILMAIHRCSASEAFDKLVEQSQHRNVKLHQVALELIARVARTTSGPAA